MTNGRGRNVGASVRARLGNFARVQGVAFDYLLNRYAVERLLYRLSCSSYRDSFVLKGATLLRVWSTSSFRPTRDVDLYEEQRSCKGVRIVLSRAPAQSSGVPRRAVQ